MFAEVFSVDRELFDAGMEEGLKQGIEQGREKGIDQAKMENALNLLDLLDNHTIADRIGIPLELVQQLRINNSLDSDILVGGMN